MRTQPQLHLMEVFCEEPATVSSDGGVCEEPATASSDRS